MRLDRELADGGGHANRVDEVGDWNGDCHPHGGYLHQHNRQRFCAARLGQIGRDSLTNRYEPPHSEIEVQLRLDM